MKNNITGTAEITVDAPADKVWDALTKPEIIKKYFFGTDTKTDWKPGSKITFSGEWEGKKYEDKGTIIDVKPKTLIKYSYWSEMSGIEDKPENYVVVSYELSEDGKGTKLKIKQENIPTEEMKKHSEGNWKKVIENLKEVVEKGELAHK